MEAKTELFNFVSTLKPGFDDVPRNKQRKSGDSKRRLDVEDILAVLEFLDVNKVELPVFVAKNLRRLPTIREASISEKQRVSSRSICRAWDL